MRKSFALIIVFGVLMFIQSINAQTWTSAKRLTWNPGYSTAPAIASDSNDFIHMVWEDDSKDGNYEIFHKRSTDGGTSWSKFKRLAWNSGWSSSPAMAIDPNDNIHVVWSDDTPGNSEIYYKKSTNGGVTWGSTRRLTYNSGISRNPSVATNSGNTVHVTWSDNTPGNREIYYKKSTNGGMTWVSTKRITYNSGPSASPDIAVDTSNRIHVVWQDTFKDSKLEIYYKLSSDGGTTWTTRRLTWTYEVSTSPAIVAESGNNIHIVWEDDTPGNPEIYYKRSTNGGIDWSGNKKLSWNSGDSLGPASAVGSSSAIHVVWYDGTPGNNEIYYKRSTDSGVTWAGTKRLYWTSDDSIRPAIAVDSSNNIHVVWQDDAPGNNEIYYRKGIQ